MLSSQVMKYLKVQTTVRTPQFNSERYIYSLKFEFITIFRQNVHAHNCNQKYVMFAHFSYTFFSVIAHSAENLRIFCKNIYPKTNSKRRKWQEVNMVLSVKGFLKVTNVRESSQFQP